MKINVDGLSQFVTECTPDTSTLAVKATTDGCTNPANWTHDLGAGQSYGQERFFFLHEGKEVRLGECQTSTETYAHQAETVDWENHDDQLFSFPKSTVYIQAPNGRYNVKTGEVLIGAQQMPYEFDRFDIAASEAPLTKVATKHNLTTMLKSGNDLRDRIIKKKLEKEPQQHLTLARLLVEN